MATSTTSPAAAACRPLEWLNFFVADVQTGLGPFLAAYLAVLAQTPVGGFVDWASRNRSIVALALILLSPDNPELQIPRNCTSPRFVV